MLRDTPLRLRDGRLDLVTIPAQVHFCWIGDALPWAYVFAVLSAAEHSGLPQVTLHHTDALKDGPELRALRDAVGVRLAPIEPHACLSQVGSMLGVGGELARLYGSIRNPVTRTDILRTAILYLHGGVYLDMDTVTIATLRPLLDSTQFVGCEFVVWPRTVRASRSPLVWIVHLTLDLLRKAFRRMPQGWRLFRRVEKLYVRGINNAVMGAEPQTHLFAQYLHAMLAMPASHQDRPYAFGPDLLHEVVDRYRQGDLAIQEPSVFYPLPPEVSEHWFRQSRGARLDSVLSPETRVVHWYASVRTRPRVAQITPAYIRQHRHTQLYSMLVYGCLRNFLQTA